MPLDPPQPPTLEARARVHGALSDPHRLAIVEALAVTDRSPSDLAQLLGIRSNLLAHHLLTLERAGIVVATQSAGDRRRRYVRLCHVAIEALRLSPPPLDPRSVLFVCTANSARSPLAAGLWAQRSSIPAASAGTHPAEFVHPLAVAAGARHGLDLRAVNPRPLDRSATTADLVVTVCDEANEELTTLAVPLRLHWSIPDPAARGDEDAFEAAVAALQERLDALTRCMAPAG